LGSFFNSLFGGGGPQPVTITPNMTGLGETGGNQTNANGDFGQFQGQTSPGSIGGTLGAYLSNPDVLAQLAGFIPGIGTGLGALLGAYTPISDALSGNQSWTQSKSGMFGSGLGSWLGQGINSLSGLIGGDTSGLGSATSAAKTGATGTVTDLPGYTPVGSSNSLSANPGSFPSSQGFGLTNSGAPSLEQYQFLAAGSPGLGTFTDLQQAGKTGSALPNWAGYFGDNFGGQSGYESGGSYPGLINLVR
jgi:hypothetical protein